VSDTPEIREDLPQRIEAHRTALASMLAETRLGTPAEVAHRADVLVSSDAAAWHDGYGHQTAPDTPPDPPAEEDAPRADVLLSSSDDPWHDGSEDDDTKDESE